MGSKLHYIRAPFSQEGIKRPVWDYGTSKAPGPDGFSFGFIKRYWDRLEDDLVAFVMHYHSHLNIPKGCNASIFIVIPKVRDTKFVRDFRAISLMSCQYKIIDKLLANKLMEVIGSVC